MLHKKLLTVIFISVLLTSGFAQRHERMRPIQKMEELKKIKLIEILQMSEETSVRFFTKRAEHIKKIEGLNQASKEKIDQIEEMLNNTNDNNLPTLKKAIAEYLQLQENMMRERQNFFKSAEEILTMEQMGKLVVFEEKFRNEVSGLLFRERKKKERNE